MHRRPGVAFEHIAVTHAGDGHMFGPRGNVDMVGLHDIPAGSLLHGQFAFGVQTLGKESGEHGGDVLDNHDAGKGRF